MEILSIKGDQSICSAADCHERGIGLGIAALDEHLAIADTLVR